MNNLILNGYGSLIVVNTSAYIDTTNDTLYEQEDYIGQDNDDYIFRAIETTKVIILGWGEWNGSKNIKKKKRAMSILKALQPYEDKLFCFGINKDKSPKHPINIQLTDTLIPYKLPLK